jgi:hypothetical protein
MLHINAKKILATILVLAALASILTGTFYVGNYAGQETRYETVSTQSVLVAPNEHQHIHLQLNISQENRWLSIKVVNGTLREACLSDELYQDWLNGSYNVTWCEMPNPARPVDSDVYEESCPLESSYSAHYIFWNLDSPSKEVTITAYIKHKEATYNTANLALGSAFIAFGAVGLAGVGLFFAFKNRGSIEVSRKRALVLAGSLLMIGLGGFLAVTYSNPVEAQIGLEHGTLNIAANSWQPLAIVENWAGDYLIQISTDKGTIQAFHSSDGSVIGHWSNGTEYDVRDFYYPSFNGSSGLTGASIIGDNFPVTQYLVFSNVDDFSKNVDYQISYHSTYNNYFGLMAGIALTIAGAITLLLTLLKNRLKDFNVALENQK